MNPQYTSPKLSLITILKWQLMRRFNPPHPPQTPMAITYQDTLPTGDYALWLGHASVWIHLGELTVAIDPIFGNIPMYLRYTPLPIAVEQLHADVILLTHAHYDHFDKPSILRLLKKNPETIIVAPTGFWRYLKGLIPREKCFELQWWESVRIGELYITLTPSKHWSKRTPFDTNKALWGGYVIQKDTQTIYHSGDSAYGEHFKEIGERFEIDEAFLPIGAYLPEEIMKHNHTNPPEALQAGIDLGAKTVLPIHYGTFNLSDEPMNEPIEWFERLTQENTYPFKAKSLQIGDIYRFRTTSTFKST